MDFIKELGYLAIATRMKRMTEQFMRGAIETYQSFDIDFEPRWFALFYLLHSRGSPLSISEIAQSLKMSHPAVIQISQMLVKKELIESRQDDEDRRVRRLKLTDKGKERLKEIGYDVSGSLRHGGVEHLYWVKQVKKTLEKNGYKVEEEYPIGNGETVDLAIIAKNKKIAIEIETGKSDAVRNIRKSLRAGFRVISIATSKMALAKLKSEIACLSRNELRKMRLVRA